MRISAHAVGLSAILVLAACGSLWSQVNPGYEDGIAPGDATRLAQSSQTVTRQSGNSSATITQSGSARSSATIIQNGRVTRSESGTRTGAPAHGDTAGRAGAETDADTRAGTSNASPDIDDCMPDSAAADPTDPLATGDDVADCLAGRGRTSGADDDTARGAETRGRNAPETRSPIDRGTQRGETGRTANGIEVPSRGRTSPVFESWLDRNLR